MRPRKGFGLIEIMVSLVLVGIASVTIFNFLAYCSRVARIPDTRLAAVNFARETMEDLYHNDYNDASLDPTTAPQSSYLPTDGNYGKLFNRYGGTRTYEIADRDDHKLITVTVRWH